MSAPRIVYRLPRRCQPCHNEDHEACEVVLYASPLLPEALCECEVCHPAGPGSQDVGKPQPQRREVIPIDDPRHPDYRGQESEVYA